MPNIQETRKTCTNETLEVNLGSSGIGIIFSYVRINVKIPLVWYFLQSVPSPMWDL